jgi:STE24 endopeptidase
MHPDVDIPGLGADRAKRYWRTKLALHIAGVAFAIARSAWWAWSGNSARLQNRIEALRLNSILSAPAYFVAVQSVNQLTSLPLSFTSGYLIERRFGLTRRKPLSWFAEEVKTAALGMALSVPLGTGAFAVIRRRPRDWWLVLSMAFVPLVILSTRLAPTLIAPLFNRFDRLDDPALVARLVALGERAGVPIVDVYRMDMSRQTEKANAYFTGTGRSKRIVLGDTLTDRFTPEEIEAVVAHELGHQVHGDVWRLIAMYTATTFAAALTLHRSFPTLVRTGQARSGIRSASEVAALPLFALAMSVIGLAIQPLHAWTSRLIERRTDAFALSLTSDGDAYARAMERLAIQNLEDLDPPRWLVWLFYSHPPTSDRIATAREFSAAEEPLERHPGV